MGRMPHGNQLAASYLEENYETNPSCRRRPRVPTRHTYRTPTVKEGTANSCAGMQRNYQTNPRPYDKQPLSHFWPQTEPGLTVSSSDPMKSQVDPHMPLMRAKYSCALARSPLYRYQFPIP